MSIVLPQDDHGADAGSAYLTASKVARDYGASLVQAIAPVRIAAEICDVDCSIHDAVTAFDVFTRNLTARDRDVESWPDRFAAEAGSIRNTYINRIPDGPGRDRFDEAFDLFAKAKAVETRGFATRKRIRRNRDELNRALAGYSDMVSRAANPVTSEFALQQGQTAIRNQVDAGVLTDVEAVALTRIYRREIAGKRAQQFIRDDPVGAARELRKSKDSLFGDLPKKRRNELAVQATRIADATEADAARLKADRIREAGTAEKLRKAALLSRLQNRVDTGLAMQTEIAEAARDGVLDAAEAVRKSDALQTALARRQEDAERVAGLLDDPDRFLDPGDPADRRAADAFWTEQALPALDRLPPDQQRDVEDDLVINSGIVPTPLQQTVRAALLQADPDAQVAAARRTKTWRTSRPSAFIDLTPGERRRLDALTPYVDLPLEPDRIVELAEADLISLVS